MRFLTRKYGSRGSSLDSFVCCFAVHERSTSLHWLFFPGRCGARCLWCAGVAKTFQMDPCARAPQECQALWCHRSRQYQTRRIGRLLAFGSHCSLGRLSWSCHESLWSAKLDGEWSLCGAALWPPSGLGKCWDWWFAALWQIWDAFIRSAWGWEWQSLGFVAGESFCEVCRELWEVDRWEHHLGMAGAHWTTLDGQMGQEGQSLEPLGNLRHRGLLLERWSKRSWSSSPLAGGRYARWQMERPSWNRRWRWDVSDHSFLHPSWFCNQLFHWRRWKWGETSGWTFSKTCLLRSSGRMCVWATAGGGSKPLGEWWRMERSLVWQQPRMENPPRDLRRLESGGGGWWSLLDAMGCLCWSLWGACGGVSCDTSLPHELSDGGWCKVQGCKESKVPTMPSTLHQKLGHADRDWGNQDF